jgi:oligopeptide transport system substrate-binding protein
MPGHTAETGRSHDLTRARELLAEAGYPQGRGFPELSILSGDTAAARLALQWLTDQWRETLGITCQQRLMVPAQFRPLLTQNRLPTAHVFTFTWMAAHPDPDSLLRAWYWGRVKPLTSCCNEAYETLVGEARYLTDQTARLRLYRQADAMLIREAVAIPFGYSAVSLLIKPWVRYYHMSPVGSPFFERVTMEPH